jgi:hypothetical protein
LIDPKHIETLEVLAGRRGTKSSRQAAVRIADLVALLDVPPTLKSTQVSGSPTETEHNALQADVTMLFNRLKALHDALQARLL